MSHGQRQRALAMLEAIRCSWWLTERLNGLVVANGEPLGVLAGLSRASGQRLSLVATPPPFLVIGDPGELPPLDLRYGIVDLRIGRDLVHEVIGGAEFVADCEAILPITEPLPSPAAVLAWAAEVTREAFALLVLRLLPEDGGPWA